MYIYNIWDASAHLIYIYIWSILAKALNHISSAKWWEGNKAMCMHVESGVPPLCWIIAINHYPVTSRLSCIKCIGDNNQSINSWWMKNLGWASDTSMCLYDRTSSMGGWSLESLGGLIMARSLNHLNLICNSWAIRWNRFRIVTKPIFSLCFTVISRH